MTEAEWVGSADIESFLQFLSQQKHNRKTRLLACAGCRQIWQQIVDSRLRGAVEKSEAFADGETTHTQLRSAARKARQAESDLRQRTLSGALHEPTAFLAATAASLVALRSTGLLLMAVRSAGNVTRMSGESLNDPVTLIRDIFGNPFRPVTFAPSWRTDTAVALARQMYESREFSAMPILADALQDAGCDNEAVLSHCRDANQPHVRGCWVVDLVLSQG